MGMFLNYHNISDNYIPNNLTSAFPAAIMPESKLYSVQATKPYEEYDSKGNLCGFYWRQGESVNLEFNLDGEITVESDAIIYTDATEIPTYNTVGYIGQRAYNITTLHSWTCTNIIDNIYVWTHDTEFVYPENSGTSIYVSASDYLKDKRVKVTLYNFRHEVLTTKTFEGAPKIIYTITPAESAKMPKGIYYCSVEVFNTDVNFKVFDSTDGKLLVK